jgi:diguanylate cyclase (GGDEF)-like protein
MTTNGIVALLLAGVALAACGLLVLGIRRRALPGGLGVAAVSASLAVWASSNAVQLLAESHWVKRITIDVTFAAICGLTLSIWWGMTALAGRPAMTRRHWLAVAAPVPVTLALTWTGWGGLMFEELIIPAGQGPVDNSPGPWFAVHAAWAYALIFAGLWLFGRTVLSAPRRYRGQARLMVAIVVLPLAANAASITRLFSFGGHDPTPVALMITLAGLAWGVWRMGLIDAQLGLLPVARDLVVEAMRDGVVVVDGRGRVLDLNPAAAELLGTSVEEAAGRPAGGLIGGWERPGGGDSWEYTNLGGSVPRVIEAAINPIDGGDPRTARVVMLRDVTERREAQAALEESAHRHHHQSRHDPLTGLANRTLLFERLREALAAMAPGAQGPSLLILDLDGFKDLNDTFGHHAGDDVLRELGARLARAAGADAMVARLAGDEFAVLLPEADHQSAVMVALSLREAICVPFSVEGAEVGLGGSIGVAHAPAHGTAPDDLVHAADVAMYHAKRHATGVAVYASSTDVRRPDRLLLRQELRHAIGAGRLEVHYQPQAALDGRLVGVEALVRWRHPERGLLMPNVFLPLAEESDLISELTDAVLAVALRDAARWNAPAAGLRVAVNISARDLRDPQLSDRVQRALATSAVAAAGLTLEVTENALATALDASDQLVALRAEGVRVSLDDFGTGFAPLATLREMPVDELKIDRSFVRGIDDDERDAALVGGLIRLGHDLGLTVVAEGVETARGADHLGDLDCDVLQGYLLGRPRPAGDLASLRAAALRI